MSLKLVLTAFAVLVGAATAPLTTQSPFAKATFHYKQMELATLASFREPFSPGAPADSQQQLTIMQVNECLRRLESACLSAGFEDLLRVPSLRKVSSTITEDSQPELESRLQALLRLALFQAHRSDQPDERLAVCLLVQKPDIFDQWRPRSDPICLTLHGANFQPETSAPKAKSILCSTSVYNRVFAVCSRPATPVVGHEILRSPKPEVAIIHQKRPPRPPVKTMAASTTVDAGTISRIICALIWALTIALSLVALLVAGALLNAEIRRRRHGLTNSVGIGIGDNTVAPSGGDGNSSKGSLIVVTATAAEFAGMSASARQFDYNFINCEDCRGGSSDENDNDDDIQTQASDPCTLLNSAVESHL